VMMKTGNMVVDYHGYLLVVKNAELC
jgi:hypothetical protein